MDSPRIHSDQGRDFESRLIKELLSLMGIRKSRTTPYHPQGDPQPERFNRTLISILGMMGREKKRSWSQHVPYLVHAYNSTKCDSTGYSPYHLMLGREARLPADLCFGTSPGDIENVCHTRYVSKLKEDLKQAYKLASEAADRRHKRNKKSYDRKVAFQSLEVGDRVFLRNLGLKGKHKLESKWNPEPYVVVERMPNLPVFKIKREDGRPGIRTIHRDHLLPVGQFVRLPLIRQSEDPPTRPKTKQDTCRKRQGVLSPKTPELPDFSDSSSDVEYFFTHRATQAPSAKRVLDTVRSVVDTADDTELDSAPEPESDHVSEPEPSQDPESEHNPDLVEGTDSENESVREKDWEAEGTKEGNPELETQEDLSDSNESELEKSKAEVREDRQKTRAEPRPKRAIKPTIRLSYDEPGKSSDRPLTIVHRGVVITIGKH